jgi:hypothetical protein
LIKITAIYSIDGQRRATSRALTSQVEFEDTKLHFGKTLLSLEHIQQDAMGNTCIKSNCGKKRPLGFLFGRSKQFHVGPGELDKSEFDDTKLHFGKTLLSPEHIQQDEMENTGVKSNYKKRPFGFLFGRSKKNRVGTGEVDKSNEKVCLTVN